MTGKAVRSLRFQRIPTVQKVKEMLMSKSGERSGTAVMNNTANTVTQRKTEWTHSCIHTKMLVHAHEHKDLADTLSQFSRKISSRKKNIYTSLEGDVLVES